MKKIGFWFDPNHEADKDYPHVEDFIDFKWNKVEKQIVIDWLKNEQENAKYDAFLGYSQCRVCGKLNGSREFMNDYFIWPEGLLHYIEEHNVKIPELVEHVLKITGP